MTLDSFALSLGALYFGAHTVRFFKKGETFNAVLNGTVAAVYVTAALI